VPDLTVWPTDGADGSVSSEARWRKMARIWVPSGVDNSLLGLAGQLVPTLAAGPTINVTAGACWLDGHYAELATPASIPATANGLLVVRFTPADNHAELLYRDAATTCTQTLATWELPIARMLAGAMQDLRWLANTSGEIAFASQAGQVLLTTAHTPAAPADIVNIPAVYFDGGTYEFAGRTGIGFIAPASGSALVQFTVWIDGAQQGIGEPMIQCYQPGGAHLLGRIRYAPPAGVHQVRMRGNLGGGATGGAANVPGELTVRRL